MIVRPFRTRVPIAVESFVLPAHTLGVMAPTRPAPSLKWVWARFNDVPAPTLVNRSEIEELDANAILVVGRKLPPDTDESFRRFDVFVWCGKDCHQEAGCLDIEGAADLAVELASETELPVFWDGRPYLDVGTRAVPA